MTAKPSESITISEFTTTCHAVLERVRRTGASIVVTRRGEPMAEIHPPSPASAGHLWLGAMRNSAVIASDLVAPASDVSDWGVLAP